jgi:hypothetical protein
LNGIVFERIHGSLIRFTIDGTVENKSFEEPSNESRCDTEIPDRKATLPELSPAAPVFASPDENLIWWPTQYPFGVGPRRQAAWKAKSKKPYVLAALLALSHLNERAYGIICLYFRVIKPRDEINAREG